jgi:hypothetical protein
MPDPGAPRNKRQFAAGASDCSEQFVEFGVDGLRVSVLRALNEQRDDEEPEVIERRREEEREQMGGQR